MATLARHRTGGWRVRFRLHLPDGTTRVIERYRQSRTEADYLRRRAADLERGSKSGTLSQREVADARQMGLLNEEEAKTLTGGRAVEPYSLTRAIEAYLKRAEIVGTPYSYQVNRRRMMALMPWLERHPVHRLTVHDVRDYLHGRQSGKIVYRHRFNGIKRGVSPKTLQAELLVLRQIIDEAVALGMAETNPAREVDVPVRTGRIPKAMTTVEVRRLLDSARARQDLCYGLAYPVLSMAVYTGLRRSELRTLRWDEDVDLENRRIYVQAKSMEGESGFTPKSGQPDSLGIAAPLLVALQGIVRRGPWVFSRPNGGPINDDLFYKTFKKVAKSAGLDPALTLHSARHTFGSHLLRRTGDLRYVQRAMRHMDLTSTKKYVHVVLDSDAPEMALDYDEEG